MKRPNAQTSKRFSGGAAGRFTLVSHPTLFVLFMLLALSPMGGCVTDDIVMSDGRPLPARPTAPPRAPRDAQASRMTFMVGSKPEDSTGDGYPDMIHATVTLFISESRPQAIRQDGAFEFTLYLRGDAGRADAQPLAHWRIEGEALTQAYDRSHIGPMYRFQLSLRDFPEHRRPLTASDLRCRFIPTVETASTIESDGVRTIYIGRRASR